MHIHIHGSRAIHLAQGHDKRGSNDDAVLETRILLLLQAYASNLWIVFLYYATVRCLPE